MNRLINAVVIFIVTIIIGCLVYRKEIQLKLSLKFYLKVVVISFLIVIIISFANNNQQWNISLYFLLLILIFIDMLTREKSTANERLFNNIIYYCNNMASLLKGNNNVYSAIETCVNDLDNPLKKDLFDLLQGFDEDNILLKKKLDRFTDKYDYSILKQLSSIILQFQFEGKGSDKVLKTFRDDIEQLELAVKNNQKKRKMLRWQYFGLSIGSILAMYYLCHVLLVNVIKDNEIITSIIGVYILLVVICLFFVDVYFNLNISKE